MWNNGSLPEFGDSPPLLVEAGRPSSAPDPEAFLRAAEERRGWIQERLREHGGLLFRGFLRGRTEELEAFTQAAGLRRMPFLRGTTPRRQVAERVYTSTEVPASLPIPLHCEMSYTSRHPVQIAFLCCTAARSGGETPLADMAVVYEAVPAPVRRRFEERGVTYLQTVPGRALLPWRKTWREMFETGDAGEVESICRDQGIEARWRGSGTLELRNERPAVLDHPVTGRRVWFNHAHIFHPSFASELRRSGRRVRALGVAAGEALLRGGLGRRVYRHGVTYGDGSPIPLADVEAVRTALWGQARRFPWRQGDLILLDNLRIGHGRMPFAGPRLVVTALIDGVEVGPEPPG